MVGRAIESLNYQLALWTADEEDGITLDSPDSWDIDVSLSAMWRAAGSPKGTDPESWAVVATDLLRGFASYLATLKAAGRGWTCDLPSEVVEGIPCGAIARWYGESPPDCRDLPWFYGDVTAPRVIATMYAAYLDDIAHMGVEAN